MYGKQMQQFRFFNKKNKLKYKHWPREGNVRHCTLSHVWATVNNNRRKHTSYCDKSEMSLPRSNGWQGVIDGKG
jgi:hypothetical protein